MSIQNDNGANRSTAVAETMDKGHPTVPLHGGNLAGKWTNTALALTMIFPLVTAVFAVWDLL